MENNTLTEIKTNFLKVRGKTLIFRNTVYQISNISSVSLVDLSTVKSMPSYFIGLFIFGLMAIFVPMNQVKFIGFAVLAFVVWRFIEYRKSKFVKSYGIGTFMNSGTSVILTSWDLEFMKRVILTINNIMNADEPNFLTFNLENNKIIEDNSIKIGEMTGSNLITGAVKGDVVNNV